jgi:hypothetical protein
MMSTVALLSLLLLVALLAISLLLSGLVVPRYESRTSQATRGEAPATRSAPLHFAAHLGMKRVQDALAELEQPREESSEVTARYLISYAKRVYVNQLFHLRVEVGRNGACLSSGDGRQVTTEGELRFVHRWYPDQAQEREPLPDIQVSLQFSEDDFQVRNKSQTKLVPEAATVAFDFVVKPLKSEDCVLAVEIAYAGRRWVPPRLASVKLTDSYKDPATITLEPVGVVDEIVVLAREELIVETRSFLNMNAAALSIFVKLVAILLTALYIGVVIALDLTDDGLSTVIVGFTSVASILGIPLGADLWKNAQIKREVTAAD